MSNNISLKKRSSLGLIISIIFLIILLFLDLILLQPNYPHQPLEDYLVSGLVIKIFLIVSTIFVARKIIIDYRERNLYSTKVLLKETSPFLTYGKFFALGISLFANIMFVSALSEYKPTSEGDYAGVFFMILSFIATILLARTIWNDFQDRRFNAVFDINGIHIHSKSKVFDINWDQISKTGYQVVIEAKKDFPEGWAYLAMSLKSGKEEIINKIDPVLIENKGVLSYEQIKDYFGKDKLDIYIMTSFLLSKKKFEYLNNLIEYKVNKPETFDALVDAKDEQQYKDILKENFVKEDK